MIKVDGKDDFPFVKFAEHAPSSRSALRRTALL
jgi:hypothetical protein